MKKSFDYFGCQGIFLVFAVSALHDHAFNDDKPILQYFVERKKGTHIAMPKSDV